MIIPLLKDKHGNASKLERYRWITLSRTVSKLFESVLVAIEDLLQLNCSLALRKTVCSHALFIFNESVRYFMKNGSRVHCVTLDAAKAFDEVLHYGLSYKMLSNGVPPIFVKLLSWYSHLRSAGMEFSSG